MMANCPRCGELHADDPRACSAVRAVEFYETGASIRRIEYHAVDGIQAPVTEQHRSTSTHRSLAPRACRCWSPTKRHRAPC